MASVMLAQDVGIIASMTQRATAGGGETVSLNQRGSCHEQGFVASSPLFAM